MTALAYNWNDEEGDELSAVGERVARLEEKTDNLKEGQERQEIKIDHVAAKLDFTNEKLDELISGLSVNEAATSAQKRTLVFVSGGIMSALTFIAGMLWTYGKAILAWLAAVVVK